MSKDDVSKCYYYNADNSPFCCELYDNECEAQNCYFQQLQKLQQCLDEIEEIAQKMPLTSYYKKQILQLIKQTKEGKI